MPGFNQTGPMGQGPMTGRRMGRCTAQEATGQNQTVAPKGESIENQPDNLRGRGFGPGRGRGRGGQGFGMGRKNRFGGRF